MLNNIWIPDGYKDIPADRLGPRLRLKDSLDRIYAEKLDGHIRDPIESVEQGRKNFSENKYYKREYRGEEHEREQRGRGLDRGASELIFFKQRRFQILPRAFVRIFCVIQLYPPACFF